MKTLVYILFTVLLFACSLEEGQSNIQNEFVSTCNTVNVDDFKSFITISPATPEKDLKNILGKATGGTYTDDTLVFIYEFDQLKRVPIKVYVNANTGFVETVFMEILGLNGNFENDLEKAQSMFPINECEAALFGKKPQEVIALLGSAEKDNVKEDNVEAGVRVLHYSSKDKKIKVRLNFYPSQDYRLSSVVVDWF